MGEQYELATLPASTPVGLDTYSGKVHVEWDPQAAVTPLGQLPFFVSFLKVSGLYDDFIATCPLSYSSPNAPRKEDVLGTLLMSILSGHHRYAHITSLRFDTVNPQLLGMERVVSEDAARRALQSMDEEAGITWLDDQLHKSTEASLSLGPWILDTDTTVKCLYGKQEGAVVAYNPQKKGRPSHNYHSCFMGTTRLALTVEVNPGNQHTSKQVAPAIWKYYDNLPGALKPSLIRGDVFLGNEGFLCECEQRKAHYLSKLRLTTNVKRAMARLFRKGQWVNAGHGFEGAETMLTLSGWSRERRVIVLRRPLAKDIAITAPGPVQLELAFIEGPSDMRCYEYAVLVTSLPLEILSVAQLYRDRADSENCFDELKNQWGWGGYTTQDLKRCRLIGRMVAVVYNWWNLFARLAQPEKHAEAITSRPLLLHGVARQTKHAGQTILTVTSNHARTEVVQVALRLLAAFLDHMKHAAEQLPLPSRMRMVARQAFMVLLERGGPNLRLPPANGTG